MQSECKTASWGDQKTILVINYHFKDFHIHSPRVRAQLLAGRVGSGGALPLLFGIGGGPRRLGRGGGGPMGAGAITGGGPAGGGCRGCGTSSWISSYILLAVS